MRCHRIGLSPIGIIGLGRLSETSRIRVPRPPQKRTVFIACAFRCRLPVAAPHVASPTPIRVRLSMRRKDIGSENHAALPLLVCSITRVANAYRSSFGLTLLAAARRCPSRSLANIDVGCCQELPDVLSDAFQAVLD